VDWWQFIGLAFIAWFTLVLLFTPRIDYQVTVPLRPDSDDFVYVLQSACQAAIHRNNRVDIFTNGAQFYPAMRDAILAAEMSVNLEAYIFQPGEAADMLVDAMIARARAGVEVRVVLDAIGSSKLRNSAARRLAANGCRVAFYQPVTWYRLHRLNNRTHRELLVVDGRVAFTGGAGVADWWYKPVDGPTWRDTMARLDGPITAAIQGTFAENWLEACGEILTGPRHWPTLEPAGPAGAMLVKSSPSDRATVSRVVFQMLIDGAVTQRGVQVRVIVPGRITDQRWVRLASRRMYRELLDGGVRMFEYRPAMTHVKAVMVDGVWAMIGTTNIDNRSFEHNDEVNVAFREPGVTARLRHDFEADLAASDEVTQQLWIARPLFEKVIGPVCWILERQQ
jgi:cardiolipin synthase A/B